jgi:hypothetical protein
MINKDNLLKCNDIDVNKYDSDKVYKMIKKFKIAYNTLTKDSILNLILNYDKNSKNGKIDNGNLNSILKQKTIRKRSKSEKNKENIYSEKISKRKISTNNSKIIKTNTNKNDDDENQSDNHNDNDSDSDFESECEKENQNETESFSYSKNKSDKEDINNNKEFIESSYNDIKNSDVYSVKLKKSARLEKKLKKKNGIYIFNF